MIKRSLVCGWVAALTAAIVIFMGCSQATDSGGSSTPAVTPDGVVVDRTVDTKDDLVAALANSDVDVVAFILGSQTIDATVIIPAGKTVYLLNPDTTNVKTLTPLAGLEVRGTLIVSESTRLAATNTGKVFLGNTGSIQIQAGGELSTYNKDSVNNLTDAGRGVDSVLDKVRYAGGSTLTIVNEASLGIEEIGKILGYLEVGTAGSARSVYNADKPIGPSKLELMTDLVNVKPSEVNSVAALLTGRELWVKPAKEEDAVEITIPANATVEITADVLDTVETITVAGKFTAGAGVPIPALKTLNLNNGASFNAPLLPETVAIVVPEGSAAINGSTVDQKTEKISFITAIGSFTANTTYQLTASASVSTDVEVTKGATLLIPDGVTLSIDSGKKLTVSGVINIVKGGGISVAGTYVIPGLAADETPGTTRGANYGTVTVKSGGEIQSYGHLDGDGENIVEAGGKVAFGKKGDTVNYFVGASGVFNPTSAGKFIYGNGFYTIDGTVEVVGSWETALIDMKQDRLTLKPGAMLTIGAGKVLRVKNGEPADTTTARPIRGGKDAQIVVNGGTLYIDSTNPGDNNFYAKDDTSPAFSGGSVTSKTFKWEADAGGTGKAGWKAQ